MFDESEYEMTIVQQLLTPGQTLFWIMIIIPNVIMLGTSIFYSMKHKAFLLLALAAVLNLGIPYGQMVIFNRGNGINAPGTPAWIVWTLGAFFVNQGTLILMLALAVAVGITRRTQK